MYLLSNITVQFIITTSISLLFGGMSVWLSMRRPVQIPLTYETQDQQRVYPSDEKVKELLAVTHISPNDSRVKRLNFITFKLWNSGTESVTLTEDKPLHIEFKAGATILSCEETGRAPQNLEYTWWLEDEKLLLVFPLLDPKDVITCRVLITGRINDLPDISIRIPGRKRIVRANNIRLSQELFIIGVFILFFATYSFVSTGSVSSSLYPGGLWTVFLAGIAFLFTGWQYRKFRPDPTMIPSKLLWEFIKGIPFLFLLGVLFVLINHWFGIQTLLDIFLIVISLIIMFIIWVIFYVGVTTLLGKKKIEYNSVLVGILASIPSLALLYLFVLRIFL